MIPKQLCWIVLLLVDSGFLFSGSRPSSQCKDPPPSGNCEEVKELLYTSLWTQTRLIVYTVKLISFIFNRLLLSKIWKSTLLSWTISNPFRGRIRHFHLQLRQAAPATHQSGQTQHQWAKAAALFLSSGAFKLDPTAFVSFRAKPRAQQRILAGCSTLPFTESWYRALLDVFLIHMNVLKFLSPIWAYDSLDSILEWP